MSSVHPEHSTAEPATVAVLVLCQRNGRDVVL